MLRELVDRFAYRYRRWTGETQGGKVGAGEAPPELSLGTEPAWRLIIRLLQVLAAGLIFLAILYRFAMRTFPSLGNGISMIFILFAVVWCSVGLFMMGGELLTKYNKSGDDDKSVSPSTSPDRQTPYDAASHDFDPSIGRDARLS